MWRFGNVRLIHSDASAETLGFLRIWVFGIAAARVVRMPLEELGRLPSSGFQPFGILRLVPDGVWDGVLSPAPLAALKVGLLIVLLAAAAGVAPRTSTALGALGLMVAEGVARGYGGYVNHAQLPLIFVAMIVAASPSGDALALWNRRRGTRKPEAYQFALFAAALVVSASFWFIGSHRMSHGAPEIFTSNSLAEWILWWNLHFSDPAATLGVQAISNPLGAALLKFSFPLITLLEISAPLCLFSRRFRLFFLPAILATQLGIYLLMTINFVDQALLYLLFIDSRYWSPAQRPT
jgi:hypothetical protein